MREIYGIIFDVDGTLYHQSWLRLIVAARFVIFGIIRPFKTLRAFYIVRNYRAAQEWLRQRNSTIALPPDTQLDRTVQTTQFSHEEISTCVNEWMGTIPLRFLSLCSRRRLFRLIHCWDRLGVPMGAYSDYPSKNKLKALGLTKIIHVAAIPAHLITESVF